MNGKQHRAIAICAGATLAAVAIVQKDVGLACTAIPVSAVAGTLPDLDSPSTKAGKVICTLRKAAPLIAIGAGVGIALIGYIGGWAVEFTLTALLPTLVFYLIFGQFGDALKHREFLHSLDIPLLLTGATVWSIYKQQAWYLLTLPLVVGYTSHILADLTNYKPIRLLYFIKKFQVCFKICKVGTKKCAAVTVLICIIYIVGGIVYVASNIG